MNTVGKPDTLGGSIRCVVSVSMLTEGWDARTVTHVLGVRAFGTQLLCEQVIGRALRRQSYDPNDDGLFDVEYADVLGIPFDFTAEPVPVKPQKPRETVRITRQWLDDHRVCKGGTYPAQLMYQELADMACERITAGIVSNLLGERPILRGAST